jgi:hypothetical protein
VAGERPAGWQRTRGTTPGTPPDACLTLRPHDVKTWGVFKNGGRPTGSIFPNIGGVCVTLTCGLPACTPPTGSPPSPSKNTLPIPGGVCAANVWFQSYAAFQQSPHRQCCFAGRPTNTVKVCPLHVVGSFRPRGVKRSKNTLNSQPRNDLHMG